MYYVTSIIICTHWNWLFQRSFLFCPTCTKSADPMLTLRALSSFSSSNYPHSFFGYMQLTFQSFSITLVILSKCFTTCVKLPHISFISFSFSLFSPLKCTHNIEAQSPYNNVASVLRTSLYSFSPLKIVVLRSLLLCHMSCAPWASFNVATHFTRFLLLLAHQHNTTITNDNIFWVRRVKTTRETRPMIIQKYYFLKYKNLKI